MIDYFVSNTFNIIFEDLCNIVTNYCICFCFSFALMASRIVSHTWLAKNSAVTSTKSRKTSTVERPKTPNFLNSLWSIYSTSFLLQ